MEKFKQKENNNELISFSSWKKGLIQEEGGEFERVFKEFYNQELQGNQELIDFIMNSYEKVNPISLCENTWSQLENSDSFYFQKGEWDSMSKKMESHNRNWEIIRRGYENNTDMNMPIIARLPNKVLHLVSGNTRLSVARVQGVTPQVIIIDFPMDGFK